MSQALDSVLMEGRFPCAGGEDVVAGFHWHCQKGFTELGLSECPGDKRAAVAVIPVPVLGRSCVVPGSSMSHSDVPCIHPRMLWVSRDTCSLLAEAPGDCRKIRDGQSEILTSSN